jgi:hypothetical protein
MNMNPDSGKLHEVAKIAGVDRIVPPRKPTETIKDVLRRAEDLADKRTPDSEPLPGSAVPDGWPRFNVGDEVGPVKGWWMKVEGVNVLEQTITLKPSRRAGRKRGKTATRKKRGKGFHKGKAGKR